MQWSSREHMALTLSKYCVGRSTVDECSAPKITYLGMLATITINKAGEGLGEELARPQGHDRWILIRHNSGEETTPAVIRRTPSA